MSTVIDVEKHEAKDHTLEISTASTKAISTGSIISPDASVASIKPTLFDSSTVFETPTRKPLKVNVFLATFNVLFSFGLIAALIAGYGISLVLVDFGLSSIGLYGAILMSQYFVQLTCALFNRHDINRIVKNRAKKVASYTADAEKAFSRTTNSTVLNPEAQVSIAVVGYREDEKAWRECLRSLQKQDLRPKCIIGVVDGNDEPDLDMANAFIDEFKSFKAPLIHLPLLLADVHRDTYFNHVPEDTRGRWALFRHWVIGRNRPGHLEALAAARQAVVEIVLEWDAKWNIHSLDAVCFAQPHGHKRTAMFTAFAMAMYAKRTRDAIFTTDSDTLVRSDALDEMMTLLRSSPDIGGITADVKIWNRSESLLARLCAARYWFAFNIERACQSLWRCVGCLSGPMSMYRTSDLETVLGPWNLQSFGGKPTTFGDDRHLTNQLLGHGLQTRYTHRTWCDSESPTVFVRWVTQQTRWSKSFFREAFWFPKSFVYHSPWLLVETTIQTIYPFILIATVFRFMFDNPADHPLSPVVWLIVMFGVALFKSALACCISRDPWILLFSIYGFVYFFGLLPSKVWALFTMNQTGWGTSARSSTEMRQRTSFSQRSFQIFHLVAWYSAIFIALGFFFSKILHNNLYLLIAIVALFPCLYFYWEQLFGGVVEWIRSLRPRKRSDSIPTDVEAGGPESPQILPSMDPPRTQGDAVSRNRSNSWPLMSKRDSDVLTRTTTVEPYADSLLLRDRHTMYSHK